MGKPRHGQEMSKVWKGLGIFHWLHIIYIYIHIYTYTYLLYYVCTYIYTHYMYMWLSMYICVTKLMYVILIQRICVICHVYNMYVYDDCSQQKMTISEIECIYWSLRHQANHHNSPLAATQSQWLRSLRIPPDPSGVHAAGKSTKGSWRFFRSGKIMKHGELPRQPCLITRG